jgi:anionic cell wall polymer biosynthesis LytR-Cps2A-Psr (LCP) family protein
MPSAMIIGWSLGLNAMFVKMLVLSFILVVKILFIFVKWLNKHQITISNHLESVKAVKLKKHFRQRIKQLVNIEDKGEDKSQIAI